MQEKLRKKLEEAIESVEGFMYHHDNGFCVEVKNVTCDEEEPDRIYADVTLDWQMEGRSETYRDCEYSKKVLLGGE